MSEKSRHGRKKTDFFSFQLDAQSFSYLGQGLIQKEFTSLAEILVKQNQENTALQEKLSQYKELKILGDKL